MADGDKDKDLVVRMIEQLRADMAEDREASRASRARTHERIDEVVHRLGRIDTTIALAGEVDAQVRTEITGLKTSIDGMSPTVDEWRRIKRIGMWTAGIVLGGGISIGAVVAAIGDQAATALRHWLRIN